MPYDPVAIDRLLLWKNAVCRVECQVSIAGKVDWADLIAGTFMAKYYYIALVSAVAGREQEFDAWYDGRHLADVTAVPGITSARRYEVMHAKAYGFVPPGWRSLAFYEIETDGDPQIIIESVKARSGTDLMPSSDTVERDGMLQLIFRVATPT